MESKERILVQGGVYMCNLSPNIGSEQGGNRPCIVVSNKFSCIYSPTVLIVPVTSQKKKLLPTHLELFNSKYPCFFKEKNVVLCEQLRTIDKVRIGSFIGTINKKDLNLIIDKINENF